MSAGWLGRWGWPVRSITIPPECRLSCKPLPNKNLRSCNGSWPNCPPWRVSMRSRCGCAGRLVVWNARLPSHPAATQARASRTSAPTLPCATSVSTTCARSRTASIILLSTAPHAGLVFLSSGSCLMTVRRQRCPRLPCVPTVPANIAMKTTAAFMPSPWPATVAAPVIACVARRGRVSIPMPRYVATWLRYSCVEGWSP